MPQIINLTSAKGTFCGMQLKVSLAKRLKQLFKVSHVVLPCIAIDNDIVNIADRGNPFHAAQQHIDHALKDSGTGGKTERQPLVLPLTIGCNKTRFRPILFLNLNLIKAIAHVHNREIALVVEGR